MSLAFTFICSLIFLAIVGLLSWAWSVVDRVEEMISPLSGFEGDHFEIGPQAANYAVPINSSSAG